MARVKIVTEVLLKIKKEGQHVLIIRDPKREGLLVCMPT